MAWPWLVRHCGWLLNRYNCGPSGRTAYQQLNACAYSGEIVEFGEAVLWRESTPGDANRWMPPRGRPTLADGNLVGQGRRK